jgi:hypothetical protein
MIRIGLPAAAAAALFFAAPALAQSEGFRSPTGNIHCQFFADDGQGAPVVRCDLRQISNRPPPRPRDCDLEWGQAFEVSARAARGIRLCYGDTVQDNSLPVLPYGRSWQRGGISCVSGQTGVTCQNGRGAGFAIARAAQRVF